MTIAVTGGTGFVGQCVIDVLRERGFEVRALARTVPAELSGVEWIEGDLSDKTALAKLCAGAEAVIHIAGLTNATDPARFDTVNVLGTLNVVEAAMAARVKRFVNVSSLSAREPGLSAYGASKAKAERLVGASPLDWTSIRPPAIYGPRDRDMLELFKLARWGVVPMPPAGKASMIHVRDLAELLVKLIPVRETSTHRMFEPDDGRKGGWAHGELAQAIGAAMGKRVWAPNMSHGMLATLGRVERLMKGDAAKLTTDRVGYLTHPELGVRSAPNGPAAHLAPAHRHARGVARHGAMVSRPQMAVGPVTA